MWTTLLRKNVRDAIILAILASYFLSPWSSFIPAFIKAVIILMYIAFFSYNLYYYFTNKNKELLLKIFILEDEMGFSFNSEIERIPYSYYTLSNVKKVAGEVVSLKLKGKSGELLELDGFDDMNGLYRDLKKKVVEL